MALDGLRWSRDSGSANCDMPRSAVFGRSGGGELSRLLTVEILSCLFVHSLMLSTVSLIFLSPFLIIKVNISLFYCIVSSKKTRFSIIISIFASQ